MRIAQIAPLAEAVPPLMYGGTERVVHNLTETLVRRGHDVTLYATADSRTSARLVPCAPAGLRLCPEVKDWHAYTVAQLGRVVEDVRASQFDIVHNHIDYIAFPALAALEPRQLYVTTLHGRLDLPDLPAVYRAFPRTPVISISDAQRRFLPHLRWLATVYHGIPVDEFPFAPRGGDYLAFLGRINPEKRPDRAIAIARALGLPLRIAAKVDPTDRAYHEREIAPLIDGDLVQYIGELDEAAKREFLAGAYAYLFPIDWPEPFGLTMIESMAVGTPVIAMRCGSVPEVVADGVSGFICDSVEEMIAAVGRVPQLDRHRVREYVAARFSVERMAEDYERLFARMLREAGRRPFQGMVSLPGRSPSAGAPGREAVALAGHGAAPRPATAGLVGAVPGPVRRDGPRPALHLRRIGGEGGDERARTRG